MSLFKNLTLPLLWAFMKAMLMFKELNMGRFSPNAPPQWSQLTWAQVSTA